jgi:DNA-binding FrmR family transcriptional regulator
MDKPQENAGVSQEVLLKRLRRIEGRVRGSDQT